jgi:hypothetical protein
MKVVSPLRYHLGGDVYLEKGETVVDYDRLTPAAKHYLDGFIRRGVVKVLDAPKPPAPAPAPSVVSSDAGARDDKRKPQK